MAHATNITWILIAATLFSDCFAKQSNMKMTKIKLMMNGFRIHALTHALLCIFRSAGNFCHFHKNDGQQNNKQWIDDSDDDADDDGDDSTFVFDCNSPKADFLIAKQLSSDYALFSTPSCVRN